MRTWGRRILPMRVPSYDGLWYWPLWKEPHASLLYGDAFLGCERWCWHPPRRLARRGRPRR